MEIAPNIRYFDFLNSIFKLDFCINIRGMKNTTLTKNLKNVKEMGSKNLVKTFADIQLPPQITIEIMIRKLNSKEFLFICYLVNGDL